MSNPSVAQSNPIASLAFLQAKQHLQVEIARDWALVEKRWGILAEASKALPFQYSNWLRTWYQTFGQQDHVTPLLVTLVDPSTNEDLLALPLCLHVRSGLKIISFADLGYTDYNAPLIHPDIASHKAEDLLARLLLHLPSADVLELEKMPARIGSYDNPFLQLKTERSKFSGNLLHVPQAWDDWHWGLERTFRKELERSWRVFTKDPQAVFKRIEEPEEARAVFAQLKTLQAKRIRGSGLDYSLDQPVIDAFYDQVLLNGLASGESILTALMVGDEVVAGLLGVRAATHYAMVRLGTGGEKWKTCSPGRLVIERTMRHLHEQGFRTFDFTIGDYAYKRRLGVDQIELYDYRHALSMKGQAYLSALKLKAALKSSPLAAQALKSMRSLFKKPNPPHGPSGGAI